MNEEGTKVAEIFEKDINKLCEDINAVIEAHNKLVDEYEELQNQLQQKENIIKEVREYIEDNSTDKYLLKSFDIDVLLEILDKKEVNK